MSLYYKVKVTEEQFEVGFYVRVSDWAGMDVVDPKLFGRFDEAFEYLYDVDCEKYVDEQWEEFRKMI